MPQLGQDRWCVTWRLYTTDGDRMPHDRCPMADAIREKRPNRGAVAIALRPDGSRRAFSPYATPLLDDDGELTAAINILIDVSEEQAEALANQARRCRTLSHSTTDRPVAGHAGQDGRHLSGHGERAAHQGVRRAPIDRAWQAASLTAGIQLKGREMLIDTRYADKAQGLLRIVAALLLLLHATSKLFNFPPFGAPVPVGFDAVDCGHHRDCVRLAADRRPARAPAAFIISGEMAVAYWMKHAPQSTFPSRTRAKCAILFCFIFLFIAAAGPGAWSIDGSRKARVTTVELPDAG